jgi:hypothetical protein
MAVGGFQVAVVGCQVAVSQVTWISVSCRVFGWLWMAL